MTESASAICNSIAHEIRSATFGGHDQAVLVALVESLCVAPARSPVDVLALAAIARKLLVGVADEHADDDPAVIHYAITLIHRVVETLECETGISGECFTGEAGVIN